MTDHMYTVDHADDICKKLCLFTIHTVHKNSAKGSSIYKIVKKNWGQILQQNISQKDGRNICIFSFTSGTTSRFNTDS